ncbi:hypothetical protein SAMN04487897_10411 [Paenibacillus sp. yr247]|uniref:hypothetical protein n=1 Tax=Paenibacillus sp. yr247 TaxID=1761880 RepID=UPI00089133EC|nr:hypothetical protein [Paenibacillus sp. yr247]SDN66674.1 hypothetical protein SAMN04487897_10411 [Paenibacillus sp. yr247]
MQHTLLSELTQLITELKQKEAETVYTIPGEIMSAVKKAKNLERFLHEVFQAVNGSGGVNIISIIRREFGMRSELANHIDKWAPYSRDQLEDELHDAIDRAEIRPSKQSLFFEGNTDKKEVAEALSLLKSIAHAAVRCQFNPKRAGVEAYIEILDHLIRFYRLPNTHSAGNMISYRNLISSDRLYSMSGNNELITTALKAFVKEWYQCSSFTFLEDREWYYTYESVREYTYILADEQLERLQNDFIQYIRDEFILVEAKPELHKAEQLKTMLETVLSWKAPIEAVSIHST